MVRESLKVCKEDSMRVIFLKDYHTVKVFKHGLKEKNIQANINTVK